MVKIMSKKLWVDDMRDPSQHVNDDWTWVKNSTDAFREISSNKYSIISLDNDLGEDVEGKHIFNWIEERLYWKDIDLTNLKEISIHSSNIEAVRYIMGAKSIMKEKYGIDVYVIR